MPDNLTKEQRSKCMSNIRSKWTLQEKKLHNYLKGNKIKHKMHPKLTGNPDILLVNSNTLIFLHGCFWHKCPKCYKQPKTKKKYWIPKIENNVKRDRKNQRLLKKEGYKVIIIWEHEIKMDFGKAFNKIIKIS
jgi:DNA mismatch endonuclease, patch repair protein